LIAGFVLAGGNAFAQGESAMPFLLLTPFAEANGMGEASVGNHTDDPLAPMVNPAHLGMLARHTWFSFGYNYTNRLPLFQQSDLSLQTFAFNGGVNLKKLDENLPPVSIGLGFSRLYLDLGEFVRMSTSGPEPIGTYEAWESSNQFTAGIEVDFWIRAAAGVTFRSVTSHLSPVGTEQEPGVGEAEATLHDVGFLVDIPLVGIVSELMGEPIEPIPSIFPYFDWSFGVARNNLGQESITYIDSAQADPLPRQARAGMGLGFGVQFRKETLDWRIIGLKWTIEASDLLVRRNAEGWKYQEGLGDIRFFDEVILGRTNSETEKRSGWEVSLLEILSLRGGRYEEDPMRGNRRFTTTGWGVRLAGIPKLLRALDVPLGGEGIAGFLLAHLDVRFDSSQRTHPLLDDRFDSVCLVITN